MRGRIAPRNARLMILSNNHVLANVNAGPINESILQPGPFDGGRHPADQVAVLERFIPISFAAGVWVERQADGSRVVVLHHSPAGPSAHLPRTVNGLPTRIVGGEPIRAYRAV